MRYYSIKHGEVIRVTEKERLLEELVKHVRGIGNEMGVPISTGEDITDIDDRIEFLSDQVRRAINDTGRNYAQM